LRASSPELRWSSLGAQLVRGHAEPVEVFQLELS
jgi:hypothetical protein